MENIRKIILSQPKNLTQNSGMNNFVHMFF